MRTKTQIQADIDKIKAGLENELIPEPIKADMRKNALPKLEKELKEVKAEAKPKAEKTEKPIHTKKAPTPKKEASKPEPKSKPKTVSTKKAIPQYVSGEVYEDIQWEHKGGTLHLAKNVDHPFEVSFNGVVIPSQKGQKLIAIGNYQGQLSILDPSLSKFLSNLTVMNRNSANFRELKKKLGADEIKKMLAGEKSSPAIRKKKAAPAPTPKIESKPPNVVPLKGVPTKVKTLDKKDRPDRNMTDAQAKAVAAMIEDYRAKGKGKKVEQVVIMKDAQGSGKVVLFLHDTTDLFFPKFYLAINADGRKSKPLRKQPKGSYRIVMGKKSFKELYSTKQNTEQCAISARKLFAGNGDAQKLAQYLHTCGDLNERKAKVANMHQASGARYAQLKEAGLAYSKENPKGVTYAQVLAITSGDFLQDEKIIIHIEPKEFVKRIA